MVDGKLVWDGFLVAVVLLVAGLVAGCAGSAGQLAFEYRLDVWDSDCNGKVQKTSQTLPEPL